MWCDACRSVGTIHCAHPDECGNMLSNNAAAENWNAWLDDLPISAEFHPAIDRLQDFIAGLAVPTPAVRPDADELVGHMTKLMAAGLDRIEALTAERDRLRRALHYYADFHSAPSDGPWGVNSDDFGAEARAALKGETP